LQQLAYVLTQQDQQALAGKLWLRALELYLDAEAYEDYIKLLKYLLKLLEHLQEDAQLVFTALSAAAKKLSQQPRRAVNLGKQLESLAYVLTQQDQQALAGKLWLRVLELYLDSEAYEDYVKLLKRLQEDTQFVSTALSAAAKKLSQQPRRAVNLGKLLYEEGLGDKQLPHFARAVATAARNRDLEQWIISECKPKPIVPKLVAVQPKPVYTSPNTTGSGIPHRELWPWAVSAILVVGLVVWGSIHYLRNSIVTEEKQPNQQQRGQAWSSSTNASEQLQSTSVTATKTTVSQKQEHEFDHPVQTGDTVIGIARKYGTTEEKIREWNPWIPSNGLIRADKNVIRIRLAATNQLLRGASNGNISNTPPSGALGDVPPTSSSSTLTDASQRIERGGAGQTNSPEGKKRPDR
jgi:tetratricopeptide (TPR) repeat protein